MEDGLFEQAGAGWGRWRNGVGGERGAVVERSGKVRWVEGSSQKPGWEGRKSIGCRPPSKHGVLLALVGIDTQVIPAASVTAIHPIRVGKQRHKEVRSRPC